MKPIFKESIFLALLISSSAFAMEQDKHGQSMSHDSMQQMDHAATRAPGASKEQLHRAHGLVNKVDFQGGTVNLTHGPIKSLGWSGMTMDFKVRDKAILSKIKAGQEVDFDVVKEGSGQYFIVRMAPSK